MDKNNLSKLMTAKELQQYLKIGKNTAYRMINNNEVPTVKIGNRVYVVADKLQRYIDTHTI
jgi:excisionase family DNA binding protein